MGYSAIARLTRPRTFLYLMTLRTGTELVTLSLLINKVTGVYGFLAIFTGYHLSGLQLSMYIYSIIALALTAILSPHIRKQSPLQCLSLAWFYTIDSLVNALYTAAFAVAWFLVLAKHTAPLDGGQGKTTPGGDMIGDTAGFTNPKYNVSHVDVVGGAASDAGLIGHLNADGTAAAANSGADGNVLSSTILHSGSIASIVVMSALWALRIYFIFIVVAYARGVLRQSIHAGSTSGASAPANADSTETLKPANAYLENPFANMAGWRGKLGRAMTRFPKSYWLGPDLEGDSQAQWARECGGRFGTREPVGVAERERRRRAGTGPPLLKPIELGNVKK